MSDVQSKEYKPRQLGQVIVAELQIEDDQARLGLEGCHRVQNLLVVRELTKDVQAVLLHATLAGGDFGVGGAALLDALKETAGKQEEEA